METVGVEQKKERNRQKKNKKRKKKSKKQARTVQVKTNWTVYKYQARIQSQAIFVADSRTRYINREMSEKVSTDEFLQKGEKGRADRIL